MEQENKTQNKIVQTYAEDMTKVLEDDKSGIIKKIIHEEEDREKEKKNISPESVKNRIFMFVSLLLVLVGSVILFYFIFGREIPSVSIEQQFTPLIFNDASTSIEVAGLDKDKIIQNVYNTVNNTKVKKGGVEGIYLFNNKKEVGLREFIRLIKGNFVPGVESGNGALFVGDRFLMGAVNTETQPTSSAGADFFMLIKVRSTTDIFDAVRTWEKKMFLDLHGFFGVDITPETKDILNASFEDGIVENKNARILYQKDGEQDKKIVMMYIFADDNSVVITNTEAAAHEIMLRLAASRVKK